MNLVLNAYLRQSLDGKSLKKSLFVQRFNQLKEELTPFISTEIKCRQEPIKSFPPSTTYALLFSVATGHLQFLQVEQNSASDAAPDTEVSKVYIQDDHR